MYRAVRDLRAGEVPLLRPLFALRGLPARFAGRRGLDFDANAPLLEQMLRSGFAVLGERPDEELVVGAVGRFWKPAGELRGDVRDLQSFRKSDSGMAKAALSFRIEQGEAGHVMLSTETRINVPDSSSRRKFRLYWWIILPGSALIRRMWLQAVKRRAEEASNAAP